MTLSLGKYRAESMRLPGWDYASPGWYFVTICTRNRVCCLGDVAGDQVRLSEIGVIADAEMKLIASHYQDVQLDCCVIMPNHVHAVIAIDIENYGRIQSLPFKTNAQQASFPNCSPRAVSLSTIVRSYKAGVTSRCHLVGLAFAWQPRFYEHIVRSDATLNAIREYIAQNPRNWVGDVDNFLWMDET
jgi:putative transposase